MGSFRNFCKAPPPARQGGGVSLIEFDGLGGGGYRHIKECRGNAGNIPLRTNRVGPSEAALATS